MFGVCFMFLFSFCVCRLSKVARRSSGVHLFVLITNLVCVGVTLLRGAPVYFFNLLGLAKPTEPQRCANLSKNAFRRFGAGKYRKHPLV